MNSGPTRFTPDRQLQYRMMFTIGLLGLVYGVFVFVLLALEQSMLLIIVVAIVLVQFLMSDKLVLVSMKAKFVSPDEEPDLYRIVRELSSNAGIPVPKVGISSLSIPNAFAAGRSQKSASVVITEGLRALLTENELRAVLAHEISHIRTRDVVVMTYASFFSVVASTLMSFLFWMGLFGGFGRRRDGAGSAILLAYFVVILVWLVSQVLIATLSRYREYAADRGAAQLTGQPMQLASALGKIESSGRRVPKQELQRSESMNSFFIMPAIGDGFAKLFSTHPSTEDRINRLEELASGPSRGHVSR